MIMLRSRKLGKEAIRVKKLVINEGFIIWYFKRSSMDFYIEFICKVFMIPNLDKITKFIAFNIS